MKEQTTLTCVIPAFNEAPRIGAVLKTVLATAIVDEVIVVDDGSSDGTVDVVVAVAKTDARIALVRQPGNGGKTRAVAAGVARARGTYLMLLDSDLIGLTPEHLARLADPVLRGRSGAALSLRGNAPGLWRFLGVDYISGERVMPRAILAERLPELDALPRFGLEVYMNRLWLRAGMGIAVVRWSGVQSPMKRSKRASLWDGLRADLAMLRDIFNTVSPFAALGQIWAMRLRRI